MPRIKIIEPEQATGRLSEIYHDIHCRRGKIAEVHKIQSMRPESIIHHMDLYLEIMFSHSELSRAQREMMAVVVSVANGCSYCQAHHAEALNYYWKDAEKLALFVRDPNLASLKETDLTLCRFADHLTSHPDDHESTDHTMALKQLGFSDSAILDATLVIAYFNFVNRIVLALGVESTPEEIRGYQF